MSHETHVKTTDIAIGLLELLDGIRKTVELPTTASIGDIHKRVDELMEIEAMYKGLQK